MAWVGSNFPRIGLFLINLAITLFFAHMIDRIFESYRLTKTEPMVTKPQLTQKWPWWPRVSQTLPLLALFPIAVFGCGAVVGLAGMAAACSRFGAMRMYHGMLSSVLLGLFSILFFLHYAVHAIDLDDRNGSIFVDHMATLYERTLTKETDLLFFIWEYIQRSYRCCGMVGDPRQTIMETVYYQTKNAVPLSCCRFYRSVHIVPVNEKECTSNKKYLHLKTCLRPLLNFISALMLVWGSYAVGVIAVCMYLIRCCYGNCAGGLVQRKCACYLRAKSTYRRRFVPSRVCNALLLLKRYKPDCLRYPCSLRVVQKGVAGTKGRNAECTIQLSKKQKFTRIHFRNPSQTGRRVESKPAEGPFYLDVCPPNTPGKETRPR